MRAWQPSMILAVGVMALAGLLPPGAAAQDYEVYPVEARVWLDRGSEPVLQRGERARIYYRVSESAFVAIFHIDTNGTVRMVFPSSPQENHYARGGRDYRVLFPGSSYWYVEDDPGVGYFFIVASPDPFDFGDFGYSHFTGGWDLGQIGRQVYGDPYLAMDDYVAALIPEWEYVGYGLDFTSYHVERHYEYPRFLCYDCHQFQPYYSWNPYLYSCTSFRVVIYSDPYYYPATRYRGTRVVYVQPRRGVARFGFKERAVGEVGTPQVVVRNNPPVSQPGVEGPANRRAVPRTSALSTFRPGSSGTGDPGVQGNAARRTGSATGQGARTSERPVLQRRPSGAGSSTTPPTSTRPTGTAATRPSARVRNPRAGGGAGNPAAPPGSTGGGATPGSPTIRSGGSSGRTSSPTVRSGGSSVRSLPTVRSSGSSGRSTSTVRSGGSSGRTSSPTVRSGGSPARSTPTVRSGASSGRSSTPTVRRTGGSSGAAAPRSTRPPAKPKARKPGGGGGG